MAAVAGYYAAKGRFPPREEEVRASSTAAHPAAASVRIMAGGAVQLSFDTHSPLGLGHIYLVPYFVDSRLSWVCVSPNFSSLPRVAPDCRYARDYSPYDSSSAARLTGAPQDWITVHNLDGGSYKLDVDALLREGRVIGESFQNWRSNALFPLMTAQSRAEVIGRAMQRATGRLPDARALNWFAQILIDSGPSSIASIEARLADSAPDSSAAGLLAICELERSQAEQHAANDVYEVCFQRHLPQERLAVDHIVGAARGALATTDVESVPCYWILRVLGAAGPAARPALPALTPWLDADAGSQDAAIRRAECGRESLRATLVKILLAEPRDPSLAALADRAVDELVAATLSPHDSRPESARLTSLLDTVPWSDALQRRLDPIAVGRLAICDPLEPDRLATLGRLGAGMLTLLFDHWQDMGCPREEWIRRLAYYSQTPAASETRMGWMLTDLMQRYPDTARLHYDRTRSVFTRDHLVESALVLTASPEKQAADGNWRDPPVSKRAVAILGALLSDIGYVDVSFSEKGVPRFPKASNLHWLPLRDWAIALESRDSGKANAAPDLLAALAQLAAAAPGCRIPAADETVVGRAGAGKALFVFPCDKDSPPQIVIGSPGGFKVMHFPERLNGFAEWDGTGGSAAERIMAVSDVDGDGNLEILTRRRVCDNCKGWTEAESFEYDLSEESGDWFTYLTTKGRVAAVTGKTE
jgi:hypothetical protein